MKTIEIKLYQFAELSEEAKQKAISTLYNINVDFDWWDCVYDNALNIRLKITSFDLDRGNYCEGEFTESAEECAHSIMDEHGEKCETYKTAKEYLRERAELVTKYSNGITTTIVSEENEFEFDEDCGELDKEFLSSLLEDYKEMLRKEYEYKTSEEAIIETIKANEYDFTENGTLY